MFLNKSRWVLIQYLDRDPQYQWKSRSILQSSGLSPSPTPHDHVQFIVGGYNPLSKPCKLANLNPTSEALGHSLKYHLIVVRAQFFEMYKDIGGA